MTPEQKIQAHYAATKKRFDPRRESLGPDVFIALARHWSRPVAEIKNIVRYHGRSAWKSAEEFKDVKSRRASEIAIASRRSAMFGDSYRNAGN